MVQCRTTQIQKLDLSVHLALTRLRRIYRNKSNSLETDQPALQIHILESLGKTDCCLNVPWSVESDARGQGILTTGGIGDCSLRVPSCSAGMAFAGSYTAQGTFSLGSHWRAHQLGFALQLSSFQITGRFPHAHILIGHSVFGQVTKPLIHL